MRKLVIGLAGCGQWGQFILRDLKKLGAAVIVLARSPKSVGRAQKYGADDIVESLDQLPATIDGLVIATPTDHHAAMIEEAIPLGMPIFVEKAMTHSVDAARAIVEKAGDRVFVMDKWRYHPGVQKLKEVASSGDIGKLVAIHCYRHGWSSTHNELDPIWLLAPHDLSICLHILGQVPTPIWAHGSVLGNRSAELVAVLEGEGSVKVYLDISSMHPTNQRKIVIIGENGAAELSGSYEEQVVLRRGSPEQKPGQETRLPISNKLPLEAELEMFLDYLRGGPPPMSSAAEGQSVVQAVKQLRMIAGLDT